MLLRLPRPRRLDGMTTGSEVQIMLMPYVRITLGALGAFLVTAAQAEAQTANPAAPVQIAQALQAAPDDLREGAAVLGFDGSGRLVTLREGTNDLICRASDPGAERWEAACYHVSLEPWMSRGRELRAEGVTGREVDRARWAEAEEGSLRLPDYGIILHILTGEGWDEARAEVRGPFRRWVMYVPFATAESTGLSTQPARGVPWLMDAGTPGAHVMITPEG
jgi:hypothetical protein